MVVRTLCKAAKRTVQAGKLVSDSLFTHYPWNLRKSQDLSGPHFPHLSNGDLNNCPSFHIRYCSEDLQYYN